MWYLFLHNRDFEDFALQDSLSEVETSLSSLHFFVRAMASAVEEKDLIVTVLRGARPSAKGRIVCDLSSLLNCVTNLDLEVVARVDLIDRKSCELFALLSGNGMLVAREDTGLKTVFEDIRWQTQVVTVVKWKCGLPLAHASGLRHRPTPLNQRKGFEWLRCRPKIVLENE